MRAVLRTRIMVGGDTMRLWILAAALLLLSFGIAGQSLAPEVLLLARIKSHMREELAHLPNYTCLETIARFRKEPGHPSRFQGHLRPLDTVRLDQDESSFHARDHTRDEGRRNRG